MYREVTMLEVKEVLRLWRDGVPTKRLAAQLGLDPKTVRRYLRAAAAAGVRATDGAVTDDQVREVLLALAPTGGRQGGDGWAQCATQREAIRRWLADGLRLTKIRKLLARQGVPIAYPTLYRFAVLELQFGQSATTIPRPRALGRLGWTLSRIQEATGIRRETVSGYLKAAGIAVRSRGRPSEATSKPAISAEVSTDPGPPKPATTPEVSTDSGRQNRPFRRRYPPTSGDRSHRDARRARVPVSPFRELIAEALGRGRNAMAIWQDLVDDHGFSARYASVRRFVVRLRGAAPAEARVVITTAPGEEGQVDYGGDGPMVRDATTGKYRRVRLFVLTLDCSRKCVRLLKKAACAENVFGILSGHDQHRARNQRAQTGSSVNLSRGPGRREASNIGYRPAAPAPNWPLDRRTRGRPTRLKRA
jgi:hypothetical protein